MKQAIKLKVNGVGRQDEVEPRVLLVYYLRDVLGLTGTHVGCETSICGACTIMLDGQAVKSCTMFAVQADGADITTIEGLATNGELHPVQEGFWEQHGLQCGYCTPGMIMASAQLSSAGTLGFGSDAACRRLRIERARHSRRRTFARSETREPRRAGRHFGRTEYKGDLALKGR